MTIENNSFLDWLAQWEVGLLSLDLKTIVSEPARVALVSEDLVKGFCNEGPLSSPRVVGIVPGVVSLFKRTHDLGVRHFLLFQDTHDADAVEFSAYPPHSVAGTAESETIDELSSLPFSDQFTIFPKNTISSNLGTDFDTWLEAHLQVQDLLEPGRPGGQGDQRLRHNTHHPRPDRTRQGHRRRREPRGGTHRDGVGRRSHGPERDLQHERRLAVEWKPRLFGWRSG